MKRIKDYVTIGLSALLLTSCAKQVTETRIKYPVDVTRPSLTTYELNVISDKIYQNETGGNPKYLMFWSSNEDFASLGIGHFIWYPKEEPKRFDETFPSMIDYYVANKIEVPKWLLEARKVGAPWKNREVFERSRGDREFQQLRTLLINTKALQTQFFFDRLHASIPEILKNVAPEYRKHIVNNYNALAKTKGGWYPLIDYINFKGKGVKATERYNNQGWGMLQVLKNMRPVNIGAGALAEFSRVAYLVLERRVKNSPPEKNEKKWLKGWKKRTDSYRISVFQ
jgi:hypothetical protein